MGWIKRNRYFLIGAVVAVALLGLSGFYGYSKWGLNKENEDKLGTAYSEWSQLARKPLNAGNENVDNVKLAREQRAQVQKVIEEARSRFVAVTPIPSPADGPVTSLTFAGALRTTIAQLKNEAAAAGVTLPPDYSFSFDVQRQQVSFAPGSLGPLSQQLGDLKAICDILFQAKINSIESLRRERVSADDMQGNLADYLDAQSVTNDLAVLTPYEAVFHCFSAELAKVLAGFANQSHGFIVKAINVEPGEASFGTEPGTTPPDYTTGYTPAYARPTEAASAFAGHFRGRLTPQELYARSTQSYNPYLYSRQETPVTSAATTANPSGGLEEKQLKITLVITAVRLLPGR